MDSVVATPHEIAVRFNLQLTHAESAGGGFSGAEVFKATAIDGSTLALRRTPKNLALPEERLRALHRLLAAVQRSGLTEIPVPLIPISNLPGAAADLIVAPGGAGIIPTDPWIVIGNDLWQVESWMPGTPIRGSEVSAQHLRTTLQRLDAFHTLAADHVSRGHHCSWFRMSVEPSPAVVRRHGLVQELQNGELLILRRQIERVANDRFRHLAQEACRSLDNWLPWLTAELTAMASQKFAIQPVVRDLWRAHVLFSEDQLTGLIDLSATASDHVAIDSARLLRSWFGADAVRIHSAVAELTTLRSFTGHEMRLLRTLDASSVLLSPLTWIRRRVDTEGELALRSGWLERLEELTEVATSFEPLLT
jgi:hypothetical protein